jgi:hypothetical protein
MTDSERQQILRMIDEGKITAEQGLILMQALGDEPESDDLPELLDNQLPSAPASGSFSEDETEPEHRTTDPEFDRKVNRFRRLWVIPLWIGVAITISGAYWMYASLQASGFGFWFYCAWLPFILGVLVTVIGFSSRTSRWIYVNIKQKPGQTPQRIVFAFPLSLVSWVVNFFRFSIPNRERGAVEEVMRAVFDSTKSIEPLMVDVDEDGEHVQIYIG